MNYSNQYDNQLNNEVNYDEYNRNNQIVNNIRYSQPTYENINNNNFNTLNNNYNNNNYQNSNDINSGMNEYVRQELKSRGVNLGRGNSPRSIKFAEMEKKKTLLNNIQNQINLTKSTKLEELKKRQEEDAKYLKDMVICYPFGRGGGGAPNRDKSGNVVTHRRALISDPKYNFASINVDDDYNEVWGKEKRIGRYYKNESQYNDYNNTNNNNYNNTNNNYNNNIPLNYNNSSVNLNNNYNDMNNVNYNGNNNGEFYNQNNNNNRPYSTIPHYNNNYNNVQNQTYRNYSNNYNNNVNDDYKIKENENRRVLAQKQRELEQEKENEKILKEIEEIDKEQMEIKLRNSLRNKNIKKNSEVLNNDNYQKTNNNNTNNNKIIIEENNHHIIERDILPPDSVVLDKNAIEKINKSELESRNKLNNEINKLRDKIYYQQQNLFNQINNLRNEAEKANEQRENALKEIEKLKIEISKQKNENINGRFLHEIVIHDDENKEQEVCTQTEPTKKEEDPLEINKLYKKNVERLNYLNEIEKLNKLKPTPASEYNFEKKSIVEEKPPEEEDDIYEIEITKIHN